MMKDIHNNLPLIQPQWFTWLDWVLIFFVLMVLILVYKKFFYISKKEREKNKKEEQKRFIPKSFSFKRKVKEVEEILKDERWKDFALKSTELLKLVLEKKYQENFLFATGRELQEILESKKISDDKKEELKRFFGILDPIKFAKREGKKEEGEKIIQILKEFYAYKIDKKGNGFEEEKEKDENKNKK